MEIIKNEHIGAIKEKCEKNTDFNGGILGADNPTFHASIGWDWISTIRGRNIGIWDDVYLTSTGKVTIQDPFVQVVLPLPDTTSATLTPEVIVKNHDAAPVKGILTGKIGDITFEQPVELAANEEKSVAFDPNTFSQLKVQNPRLWWPKGYGSPYLYDANFTFKVGDKVSDSEDFKVGIRQMTFNENNSILSLFINGRRFIGRGGNWGFGESNLNYRGREYDIAVAYHADMNFTMMRNWVGQIGDKELYEACDRRGMPNVMNYESLVRTFSPEALWPQNAQWGQHDYTMEGAQSCASFNAIIEKGFGKPNNAKEFAELAQWVNYDGYRGMFESRSLNRKGLLLWMTHPAWPSMVWQTYDYYFEPTAAYFGCKKASEPLHIQWNPVTDEIEVVNYSAGLRNGLMAKAQIINMDGSISWENEVSVDSKEDTTNKCMKLDFPASVSSAHFVKLTLTENGKIVSDNFYLRGVEEGNYQALREMPKVTLRSNVATNKGNDGTWTATAILENTSSTPALMIRVNVVGEKDGEQFLPVFYSDNYFSLLPGEKKEINIHWKDVDTRGETPKVVISGYNVN